MNQRSAADELGVDDGDQVVIRPLDEDTTSDVAVSPVSVDLTRR